MPLHSFVSFKAAFPVDGEPAGKELADFISSALRSAGIEHTNPEEREGWAWNIFSQAGKVKIESIIGFVDDEPLQWLITSYGHLPFLNKLFSGGGGQVREAALRPFCEAIDSAIKSDTRFSEIRWYTEKDFNTDNGDTWNEVP
jgi:hypothetical protein